MYVLGLISQKGGVGKSTLARALAREYTVHGLDVLIADLDTGQVTSFDWSTRREQRSVEPHINVQVFKSVNTVISKSVNKYDILIIDGRPHASEQSFKIAAESDVVVLPTNEATDDLVPTIRLANELRKKGIDKNKMLFVLSRVSKSDALIEEAANFIDDSGYQLATGCLHEQAIYKKSSDLGRTITETTHPSCNEKAENIIQQIMDLLKNRIDNGNKSGHQKHQEKNKAKRTAKA